ESLRTGSNRLNADLQLLEGNLVEVRDSVSPRPVFEPEPAAPEAPAAPPAPAARPAAAAPPPPPPPPPPPAAPEPAPALVDPEPYEDELYEDDYAAGEAPASAEGEDDTEGARLITLNMALNGTPREETDRYLSENFTLSNRAAPLDEVYASVEG